MSAPLPTDTVEERLVRTQRLFDRMTGEVNGMMGAIRRHLDKVRAHILAGQSEAAVEALDFLIAGIDKWTETIRAHDKGRPS